MAVKKKVAAKKKTGAAAIKTVEDGPSNEGIAEFMAGAGMKEVVAKGNKSELIRFISEQYPLAFSDQKATPKKIVELLATVGIESKADFVSNILSKAKAKDGKKAGKRGRKPGSTNKVKAAKVMKPTSATFSIEAAVAFAQMAGGIDNAKSMLDALSAARSL